MGSTYTNSSIAVVFRFFLFLFPSISPHPPSCRVCSRSPLYSFFSFRFFSFFPHLLPSPPFLFLRRITMLKEWRFTRYNGNLEIDARTRYKRLEPNNIYAVRDNGEVEIRVSRLTVTGRDKFVPFVRSFDSRLLPPSRTIFDRIRSSFRIFCDIYHRNPADSDETCNPEEFCTPRGSLIPIRE